MTRSPCVRTTLAVVLLAVARPPIAGARRPATECSVRRDGAAGTVDVTTHVGSGSGRLTLALETTTVAGGESTTSVGATMGKRMVFHAVTRQAGSTTGVTTDLGRGFRGVHHVELASTDGVHFAGQVDGRAVTVTSVDGVLQPLVFADGGPPPRVKVKRAVRRAIAKAVKLAKRTSCPATATPVVANAVLDDCDLCQLGCQVDPTKAGSLLCAANIFLTAVLCNPETAVACMVTFEVNALSCAAGAANCSTTCLTSDDCCKVHCPGAVGLCCNGDGEVCCGEDGPGGGTCCTSCCGDPKDADAVCCGRRTPQSEERTCVDPVLKLCCEPDGTICANGTECCAPGETCCGDYCAPPGAECCSTATSPQRFFFCGTGQHCVDPQTNLCCPANGGPACNGVCCLGSEVCAPGNQQCCSPLDLCGDACCPSGVCINGTECCEPPSNVCGGHCCPPLNACCNGQCCAGACVGGGICCPTVERACGNTCCGEHTFCVDPATSTCQACPGGVGEACAPNRNNPQCCPSAAQCCGNGTCCPEGTTCCASTVPGQAPSCVPEFQCVH
jgi:hypothetical protein